MKKSAIVLGLLVIAAVFVVWKGGITGMFSAEGKYDSLAKCLTEKGVIMYGAYWCPHCQNQKKMFGDSWEYVNYVECSLPNKAGQTQECNEKGIKGYPTWDINGEFVSGELSLKTLSEKSGCALN